eukprot:scaffold26127_cov74-Cyclotella_meneghiniana.AAC.1
MDPKLKCLEIEVDCCIAANILIRMGFLNCFPFVLRPMAISNIYKSDPITLTNQPESHPIPPPSSSRVMGCWGVGAEVEFVENWPAEVDDELKFVFGRVSDGGANRPKQRQR